MRREVTVELSSQGFWKTGIRSDVCQVCQIASIVLASRGKPVPFNTEVGRGGEGRATHHSPNPKRPDRTPCCFLDPRVEWGETPSPAKTPSPATVSVLQAVLSRKHPSACNLVCWKEAEQCDFQVAGNFVLTHEIREKPRCTPPACSSHRK